MRTISFQDLFSKPLEPRREPPADRRALPLPPPVSTHSTTRLQPLGASPTTPEAPKGSIGFILGDAARAAGDEAEDEVKRELLAPAAGLEVRLPALATPGGPDEAPPKRKKKRKARICKEPGCDKYVVDHGLCIRHGGGKRCNVEGCNCRAQNRGLCWKHGGYTICKVDGCAKRAKSRGICWSHGGGTRCKTEGCTKIAVSLGRCWAHGGGKRCMVDGCRKPASERTNNFCSDHFAWSQREPSPLPPPAFARP